MKVKILKTEQDYERAPKQLESVFDAPANSTQGKQAERLMSLIEEYENKHYSLWN